jgi:hypothetical protein
MNKYIRINPKSLKYISVLFFYNPSRLSLFILPGTFSKALLIQTKALQNGRADDLNSM